LIIEISQGVNDTCRDRELCRRNDSHTYSTTRNIEKNQN